MRVKRLEFFTGPIIVFSAVTPLASDMKMNSSRFLLVSLLTVWGNCVADDWPQWLGPRHDSVWRESGIVERFSTNGLPVVWRAKIGPGYSAPAVADGRVFVTDRVAGPPREATKGSRVDRASVPGVERVLCLDEHSGLLLWKHEYDCPYNFSYPSGPRAMPQVDGGASALPGDGHRPADLEPTLSDGLRSADANVGSGFGATH